MIHFVFIQVLAEVWKEPSGHVCERKRKERRRQSELCGSNSEGQTYGTLFSIVSAFSAVCHLRKQPMAGLPRCQTIMKSLL
jgi:hypothetical protein